MLEFRSGWSGITGFDSQRRGRPTGGTHQAGVEDADEHDDRGRPHPLQGRHCRHKQTRVESNAALLDARTCRVTKTHTKKRTLFQRQAGHVHVHGNGNDLHKKKGAWQLIYFFLSH